MSAAATAAVPAAGPLAGTTAGSLLELNNVEVVYDNVSLAVKGVSLSVPEGGLVAVLGANGAGKSTVLKSISGLLAAERGKVTRGDIRWRGADMLDLSPPDRVRLGLVHVLEGAACSST